MWSKVKEIGSGLLSVVAIISPGRPGYERHSLPPPRLCSSSFMGRTRQTTWAKTTALSERQGSREAAGGVVGDGPGPRMRDLPL